jgi:hypothetical protein
MKKNCYLLIAIFAWTFLSCKNEKEVLASDFDRFIQKATKEYADCDMATWKKLNDEFYKLDNRYSKLEENMSGQEKKMIDTFKGCFYSIKMKYEAKQLKDKLKSGYDKTKGFVNEMFNDS